VEVLPLQTFSSATRTEKMPTARIDGQLDQPQLDVLVDLGHPLLNRVFDGFVKVGGVRIRTAPCLHDNVLYACFYLVKLQAVANSSDVNMIWGVVDSLWSS
jgi:hypothetical protein